MVNRQKLAYSYLSGLNIHAAADGNPHLKQALDGIIDQVNSITAGQQSVNTDTGAQTAPAPPPVGDFKVQGQDGNFIIDITNPQDVTPISPNLIAQDAGDDQNQTGQPILYQLRYADDLAMSVNLTTTDPDAAIHRVFNQPNVTKYWQMRSTFDGTSFSDWQYFTSAAVCGPVPVWSGLLRNSSSGLVDSATTPQGTNPLTQDGVTTNIKVAASIFTAGDQSPIHYNAGHVDPGSFGTWLIYASDQFRAGATVTFIATANSSDVTASLYNIYFGKIITSGGGGGTGSGGGGGTCCRAGVPYRLFDGTAKDCSLVRIGDVLMGSDGGPEVVQEVDVIPARPCFHLEFDAAGKLATKTYLGDFTVYRLHLDRSQTFLAGANGIIDGACSEHTLQYSGGGFCSVFEAVVGEPFNLINGACSAHNFNKL